MQKLLLVYYNSENRATSQIWKILPNMVFPPIWGGKWRRSEQACKLCWTLLSPARVQPLYKYKQNVFLSYLSYIMLSMYKANKRCVVQGKKEFRDWTNACFALLVKHDKLDFALKCENVHRTSIKFLNMFRVD